MLGAPTTSKVRAAASTIREPEEITAPGRRKIFQSETTVDSPTVTSTDTVCSSRAGTLLVVTVTPTIGWLYLSVPEGPVVWMIFLLR